jgi:Beta/Gamma crystallin
MARLRPSLVLVAALLVCTNEGALSAQDRQIGGIGITVFEDPDYRGRSATFRDAVPDLRSFNLNDRISSLRVARGEIWEACIDIDYGGRCQVFSDTEPDLRRRAGWNDEISSFRHVRGRGGVRPPTGRPQIVLYERTSFRGTSRTITGTMSNVGNFGNRVQSVRVVAGRWELCDGTRWTDRCVTVTDSIPDVGRYNLRGVHSVRPR